MPSPQTLDQAETSLREATSHLKALFENSPAHIFLEIWAVPPSLLAGVNRFIPLRQLQRRGFGQAVPLHIDGLGNVHFGVVPRVASGHGGDANTDYLDRVWADYDVPDQPVSWPLEPSVELASSSRDQPGETPSCLASRPRSEPR